MPLLVQALHPQSHQDCLKDYEMLHLLLGYLSQGGNLFQSTTGMSAALISKEDYYLFHLMCGHSNFVSCLWSETFSKSLQFSVKYLVCHRHHTIGPLLQLVPSPVEKHLGIWSLAVLFSIHVDSNLEVCYECIDSVFALRYSQCLFCTNPS